MIRLTTLGNRVRTLCSMRVRPLTVEATARPRGADWERLRAQVLYEAAGLCQCPACKTLGRLRLATEVDHIVPLWAGGHPTDRSNLQALHVDCHNAKTLAETQRRERGDF